MLKTFEWTAYEVGYLENLKEDIDNAYRMLVKKVVGRAGSSNERYNKAMVVKAHIRSAALDYRLLYLKRNDEMIGSALVRDKFIHTLEYINVISDSVGTGVLMNVILNDIFKDKEVMLNDTSGQFSNVATKIADGKYVFNSDVAEKMEAIYGTC